MTQDDIDTPDEFDAEPIEKPSLREAWESNPMLKVAAIVLALVIGVGGYTIFFAKDEEGEKSRIRVSNEDAKQIPGMHELDPEYRKQLEEANRKAAKQAEAAGGSAMPTPISTARSGGLDMPNTEEKKTDVLAEWRKATENSRLKSLKEAMDEDQTNLPDAVPVVQPVRPMPAVKMDPNEAKNMAAQMRVIIGGHGPVKSSMLQITKEESLYSIQRKEEEEVKRTAATAAAATKAGGAVVCEGAACKVVDAAQTIVPAGSIAYASLLNELNSDIAGPALVHILSGPFAGGRAIGKVSVKNEYMVLTFTTVVKDAVSYTMNGIALDEKTTLAGQATDVDSHYFKRIILPAAAKFIEGYGSSVAETGTTVVADAGGGSSTSKPKPDAKESLYAGLEESTGKISEFLDKEAEIPVTVKIAKGTTMGVLFLDSVTTEEVVK